MLESWADKPTTFFGGGGAVFVGAIPAPLARYIAGGLAELGKPVAIGCSGNFTLERALVRTGLPIVSNDISLYTSAIGRAILDPQGLALATPRAEWLRPYCDDAERLAVAVLVLSGNWDKRTGREHDARRYAVQSQFCGLHAETLQRRRAVWALLRQQVQAYTLGDIGEHFARYGQGYVQCAFMPTYIGGYDKLWEMLEALFEWSPPLVPSLTDERRADIMAAMMRNGPYAFVDDSEERGEAIGARLATIYAREGKKPIYVYSDFLETRAFSEAASGPESPVKLATSFSPDADLGLVLLTRHQARYVRNVLTGASVVKRASSPSGGMADIGIVTPDGLIGAVGICGARSKGIAKRVAYMMYDLAVPNLHPRMSKLIIMLALSKEVNQASSAVLKHPLATEMHTAVFTRKAVSMKYRGVYEVYSRSGGRLDYSAPIVNQTMEELRAQWRTKYAK